MQNHLWLAPGFTIPEPANVKDQRRETVEDYWRRVTTNFLSEIAALQTNGDWAIVCRDTDADGQPSTYVRLISVLSPEMLQDAAEIFTRRQQSKAGAGAGFGRLVERPPTSEMRGYGYRDKWNFSTSLKRGFLPDGKKETKKLAIAFFLVGFARAIAPELAVLPPGTIHITPEGNRLVKRNHIGGVGGEGWWELDAEKRLLLLDREVWQDKNVELPKLPIEDADAFARLGTAA